MCFLYIVPLLRVHLAPEVEPAEAVGDPLHDVRDRDAHEPGLVISVALDGGLPGIPWCSFMMGQGSLTVIFWKI